METPRIEEMVEEFRNLPQSDDGYYCMECGGGIDKTKAVEWLTTALTEAYELGKQAGIDEMAEHIIGILKQSYLMTNGYKDTDTFRTAMYIENEDFNIAINKRLDFFIEQIEKALQDNK